MKRLRTNVDQFFSQWLYGAGAPKFDLSYTYDGEKHQVMLAVKQTHKVEGRVGLFRVPVEVEITTASGPSLYNVTVSKDIQTFPARGVCPLMVLSIRAAMSSSPLNSTKRRKSALSMKNAVDVADRADAVVALGKMKNDEEVVAALEDAAQRQSLGSSRYLPPIRSASWRRFRIQAASRGAEFE